MKDSLYVTESLAPRLSERGGKLLFRYTQRRAMYDCRDAVKLCMRIVSEKNPFSLSEKMRISMMLVYAKIRAMIKKIYYRLVLRVKV